MEEKHSNTEEWRTYTLRYVVSQILTPKIFVSVALNLESTRWIIDHKLDRLGVEGVNILSLFLFWMECPRF